MRYGELLDYKLNNFITSFSIKVCTVGAALLFALPGWSSPLEEIVPRIPSTQMHLVEDWVRTSEVERLEIWTSFSELLSRLEEKLPEPKKTWLQEMRPQALEEAKRLLEEPPFFKRVGQRGKALFQKVKSELKDKKLKLLVEVPRHAFHHTEDLYFWAQRVVPGLALAYVGTEFFVQGATFVGLALQHEEALVGLAHPEEVVFPAFYVVGRKLVQVFENSKRADSNLLKGYLLYRRAKNLEKIEFDRRGMDPQREILQVRIGQEKTIPVLFNRWNIHFPWLKAFVNWVDRFEVFMGRKAISISGLERILGQPEQARRLFTLFGGDQTLYAAALVDLILRSSDTRNQWLGSLSDSPISAEQMRETEGFPLPYEIILGLEVKDSDDVIWRAAVLQRLLKDSVLKLYLEFTGKTVSELNDSHAHAHQDHAHSEHTHSADDPHSSNSHEEQDLEAEPLHRKIQLLFNNAWSFANEQVRAIERELEYLRIDLGVEKLKEGRVNRVQEYETRLEGLASQIQEKREALEKLNSMYRFAKEGAKKSTQKTSGVSVSEWESAIAETLGLPQWKQNQLRLSPFHPRRWIQNCAQFFKRNSSVAQHQQ